MAVPLLGSREPGPPASVHVVQNRLVPGEFRMLRQVFGGLEIHAAGVAQRRGERHLLDAGGVGDLVLHRAGGRVGRLPGAHAARRKIDVAAQGALARGRPCPRRCRSGRARNFWPAATSILPLFCSISVQPAGVARVFAACSCR